MHLGEGEFWVSMRWQHFLDLLCGHFLQPGYYDMPFQPPTTTLSRDQGLTNVPYSGKCVCSLCMSDALNT